MNLKKILASALTAVMLVSSVSAWNPAARTQAAGANGSKYGTFGNYQSDSNLKEFGTGSYGIIADSSTVGHSQTGSIFSNGSWSIGQGKVTETEGFTAKLPYDSTLAEKLGIPTEETVKDDELVRVIVVLKGSSVVESNSDATMNLLTKMQIAVLERTQANAIKKIEKNVLKGESLEVAYQYTWLLNGFAASVPYGLIDEIEALEEVEEVLLQPVYTVSETIKKDADIQTITDGVMIGRLPAWESGYTGKGMKIAIVDTGIDDDHPSFGALTEEQLTSESLTKDDIAAVLSQLNAAKKLPGVTADQLYNNTKIAYGFNYIDKNVRINHKYDQQGDHGTHVAGIAAANKITTSEVVGVAPDAQLMVFKVFGANGGAWPEDILASMEDAMILGADVINMSLGSSGGFTTGDAAIMEIYDRVSTTDTILAVSAGNSASTGSGNFWHQNFNLPFNLSTDPDNALVSWPSTYKSPMSVGSVENVMLQGAMFFETEGTRFTYMECKGGVNEPITTIAGKEYGFVYVENCGQSYDDFANAGVRGKIAVTTRGVTSFLSKAEYAEAAGAVALIVINNTTGTIQMDMTGGSVKIPAVSIPINYGPALLSILEQNPDATIIVSAEAGAVPSPDAYLMSDFSGWGVAPDLTLKPEITAPGGNIYSCYDNGKYGLMSGTSMASPNYAGIAALVKQYVKSTYTDMSDAEVHAFVNALLMSTAEPLNHTNGLTYSPRLQGAGLANAYNAIVSRAVLLVEGCERPKVELYDDPDKKGVYTFTFSVKNFGEEKQYYEYFANALTESVAAIKELPGFYFMSEEPSELGAKIVFVSDAEQLIYDYDDNTVIDSADARLMYLAQKDGQVEEKADAFRYDLDASDASDEADVQAYLDALVGKGDTDLSKKMITVDAGETTAITVTVALTDEDKVYMDTYFSNGIYVEGFAGVNSLNGGVDLSLPYVGFYGDWTKAPILDSGYYDQPDDEVIYSQYANILWSNWGGNASQLLIGYNPYFEEPFNKEYLSVSPNADGYADYVDDIYLSLLRNAKTIEVSYSNAETGEVYYKVNIDDVTKTYYVPSYGKSVPFVFSWLVEEGLPEYKFTDREGKVLADGTKVKLSIQCALDYTRHEAANLSDTWEMVFTVDTEGPKLYDAVFVEEDGKHFVDLTFSDNCAVAGIHFLDASGAMILSSELPQHVAPGEKTTQRFEVTGFGDRFAVVLGDYACNESSYYVETVGNAPQLDESLIYGYRTFDIDIMDDSVYAWVSINPETGEIVAQNSEIYMDYAINAATYASGYIFAAAADGNLYAIVPGLWNSRVKIAELGFTMKELAYNPVNHKIYGYTTSDYSIVEIDPLTGSYEKVVKNAYAAHGMAFDKDGVLYCVETMTALVSYDTTTWKRTSLGSVGKTAGMSYLQYIQSMTYDASEDCLYWMAFDTSIGTPSSLIKIDLSQEEITATKVATLGNNAEIVGAFMLGDETLEIPEVPVSTIEISDTELTLLPQRRKTLSVNLLPWYGVSTPVNWTSSDETVATVSPSGVVYAVGVGECTITASTEDGSLSAACEVKVVNVTTELNAFVYSGRSMSWAWANFKADDVKGSVTSSPAGLVAYHAGEYADGYIYAYDERGDLYRLNPETHEAQKITSGDGSIMVKDMAFDQKTGTMYALGMSTVTGATSIYTVSLVSGALTRVTAVKDEFGYAITAISASETADCLYAISKPGFLCKIDVVNKTTKNIALMDYSSSDIVQSMTYDYEQNAIYWAMITAAGETSVVYVDPANGCASPLGSFDNGAHLTCLYVEPGAQMERPYVRTRRVEVTGTAALLAGSTMGLPINVRPVNSSDLPGTATSSDESVAYVDNGLIVAVGAGTCTIEVEIGVYLVEIEVKVYDSAKNIYGFIMTDLSSGIGGIIGHVDDSDLSHGEAMSADLGYEVYAGEYYNGLYYTYGINNATYERGFYVFDPEHDYKLVEAHVGIFPDMRDMAFDYSTGTMYGIGGKLNVSDEYPMLYAIDIETGNCYLVGDGTETANWFALACSTDGHLYAVDDCGDMYELDKETGMPKTMRPMISTGLSANVYQSMCYDHNTGNIYWAQVMNYGDNQEATLIMFDVENKQFVDLGCIGTRGCEMTGLFTIPNEQYEITAPETTGVVFGKNDGMVVVGGKLQLNAITLPISVAASSEVTYASSDTSIATVDANGVVTGIAAGTVTITASAQGFTAETTVIVLGDMDLMYVGNANGVQKAPIMNPNDLQEVLSFEPDVALVTMTYHTDGYFYGTDYEGYLYRFTMDGKLFEKISSVPFLYAYNYENLDGVFDLVSNPFDGNLYVSYNVMNWTSYTAKSYIGRIDLENEKVVDAVYLGYEVQVPCEFVFVSERDVVIVDYYETMVFTMNLDEDYAANARIYGFAFAVNFDADGKTGLAYDAKLGKLFLGNYDPYYGGGMNLYLLDVEAAAIQNLGQAGFGTYFIDLMFLNGVTPVTLP